ncbi:MAG: type IV pilin protein [Elusimicrobiota bacterium]
MSLKNLNKKGFTLIELMIVVAIIGILAAVAIPRFADLVTKSKEASVKGTLGALRSAISIYYGDQEGQYPNALLHTALATGEKYMPALSGQNSLGKYQVPQTSVAGGCGSGLTGGMWANLTADSGVDGDGGSYNTANTPIYYSTGTGGAVINLTCLDTKSLSWSTY